MSLDHAHIRACLLHQLQDRISFTAKVSIALCSKLEFKVGIVSPKQEDNVGLLCPTLMK